MADLLPWHHAPWEQVRRAWSADRLPHALLLEGPAGLGKLEFARRVAALTLTEVDAAPAADWRHPDLRETTLLEDKKQIGVNQIRELCSELFMTAHADGYKVALIHPAEKMNAHAANSLLKTLEEPTERTLLILVRSRLDTLPATIASRCQRLRFAAPDRADALAWLEACEPGPAWTRLLAIAGGAPLRARALAAAGMDDVDLAFRQDLAALLRGEESAARIAGRWQKQPLEDSLAWLNAFVTDLIRILATDGDNLSADLHIFQRNIRLASLFGYLDEIQAAIARTGTALTPQLVLEGLLVPWCHRLEGAFQGGRF
jgi:DNA polymerase-3 subunit delta'